MFEVEEIEAVLAFLQKEIKECTKRILKQQKDCTVCNSCPFEECVPSQSSFCDSDVCGAGDNCYRCEQNLVCACDSCKYDEICDFCKYDEICKKLDIANNKHFEFAGIKCTNSKRNKPNGGSLANDRQMTGK